MSAGDIVSERINATAPSTLQPQPPHFGIITDENEGIAILWDNWNKSTIVASTDADSGLDVIEDATSDIASEFIGKNVIRISQTGTAVPADTSGGTSREYNGLALAVYRRTPRGATPGSGSMYLLMKSGDTFFEDLAAKFVVLPAFG